jgi:hypothetical protein
MKNMNHCQSYKWKDMMAIRRMRSRFNQWQILSGIIILIFAGCKSQNTENDHALTTIEMLDTDTDSTSMYLSYFKKEGDAYIVPWNYMLNLKFEKKYSDSLGMEVSLPIFNDTLKVLDGKTVIAEGFYIPVDETGDETIVILSAYPFAQCFFCGQAGVESIIDIITTQKLPKLKIDTKIRFKGRFKLNRDNFDFLIYMLEDAELMI